MKTEVYLQLFTCFWYYNNKNNMYAVKIVFTYIQYALDLSLYIF